MQRFIDYRQLLKTNVFSKSDKTGSLTTTIKKTEQMRIILLIILFFIH
ncbi:MAG: lantibiotic ABC transporter permease, partial [Prevotella sp.]